MSQGHGVAPGPMLAELKPMILRTVNRTKDDEGRPCVAFSALILHEETRDGERLPRPTDALESLIATNIGFTYYLEDCSWAQETYLFLLGLIGKKLLFDVDKQAYVDARDRVIFNLKAASPRRPALIFHFNDRLLPAHCRPSLPARLRLLPPARTS